MVIAQDGTKKSLSSLCHTDQAIEIRHVLDLVGDKWSLLVMTTLGSGPRRFSEIKREIGTISQRMLTQTLRALEANGLVTRTVYPTIPPKVEYQVTELGETLQGAIQGLIDWTLDHLPAINLARAAFEQRASLAVPV